MKYYSDILKQKKTKKNYCKYISDSNVIRTHNHLVRKKTINHLASLTSLAKCLSVRLQTKW